MGFTRNSFDYVQLLYTIQIGACLNGALREILGLQGQMMISDDQVAEGSSQASAKAHTSRKGQQTEDPKARPEPSLARRVFFNWFLGVDVWRRQAQHLKRRASLPLLRKIAKDGITHNRVIIDTELIHDDFITKSIVGHRLIMVSAVIAFLYSVYLLVKGVTLAVAFAQAWNSWLLVSIPLVVFTSFRFLLSYKVHSAFTTERARRRTETAPIITEVTSQ